MIAFHNSFSIFITSFLNLVSLGSRGLTHCLLLLGNSLVLLCGNGFSDSSFCSYFSQSVSLGKTVVYSGLCGLFYKGVACVGLIYFGAKAVFSVNACVPFHSVCRPSVIPLTGGVHWALSKVSPHSVGVTALLGKSLCPRCWSRGPQICF